ncbi:hypothetical protein [Hymenobacter bucti]|uniref:DUF4134 domain-containing protein n=1 Tax=Hymenobacter bucti TaxID=1844114 RepID=A0ABW4QZB3_9BACT
MAYYSVLLFNANTYNPFFTGLGLLLAAVAIGLGYGAVKLLGSVGADTNTGGKAFNFAAGIALVGGAAIVLGLAALCATWVAG